MNEEQRTREHPLTASEAKKLFDQIERERKMGQKSHDEYARAGTPEFVINFNLDGSIDGVTLYTVDRTFTDVREAARVARRMQHLGGTLLRGIGVMHNHPECEGLLCLNKLDEVGDHWEEDFLCYYTKPGDVDQYFLGGIAHRMGTE